LVRTAKNAIEEAYSYLEGIEDEDIRKEAEFELDKL
jgi:hypothetical protein